MKLGKTLFFGALSVLCSCSGNNDIAISKHSIDTNFNTEISPKDSVISNNSIYNVSQWTILNDELVILSEQTDNAIFKFNTKSYNLVDSLGHYGQGPDEFVAPSLIESNENLIIADNGNRRVFTVKENSISRIDDFGPAIMPVNNAFDIAYPIVGYKTKLRADYVVYLQNIATGEVADSLTFSDDIIRKLTKNVEFKLSGNKQHLVCAWIGVEKFWIVDIQDQKFGQINEYSAAGLGNNSFYYVGADCGENYFALLSMKGADYRQDNSKPNHIELYDYHGKPLAKINLSFTAYSLLLDEQNSQIFLLSTADEKIHVVKYTL